MKKVTENFINKMKINTYIYTYTFMGVALIYTMKVSAGTEPMMLMLAAFAFYTLGRQANLLLDLEGGAVVDTKPRAPEWVRGVTYFVVMLMAFCVMFS